MEAPKKKTSPVPIYIALVILVVFAVVFVIEFIGLSDSTQGAAVDDALTAETYMDIVTVLLAEADPTRGEAALVRHGCTACHGAESNVIAPKYAELTPEVADARRPPLSAAAYIYESIIYPGAFIVEGYPNNMPRLYADQITDEELGDIIAYLLQPER